MRTEPPDELLARRSESGPRAVLEDWLEERGRNLRWLAVSARTSAEINSADAADDAADDADAAADADADADAAADADDADDADADADDADADATEIKKRRQINSWLRGEKNMREGLAVVVTPGSYWALVQVGWLRREEGDEWVLDNARTLRRISGRRVLSEVAKDGPMKDHECKPPSEEGEPIHRLTFRRIIYANVEAWKNECPDPKAKK